MYVRIDITSEVHMPADRHQLSKFEATCYSASVTNAESHEDHSNRYSEFSSDCKWWNVLGFTQGFQETCPVPGFRCSQFKVLGPVARELEARIIAAARTGNRDTHRLYMNWCNSFKDI